MIRPHHGPAAVSLGALLLACGTSLLLLCPSGDGRRPSAAEEPGRVRPPATAGDAAAVADPELPCEGLAREAKGDELWEALLAANDGQALAAQAEHEESLRRLLEAALEQGRTDFDVAEEAFRLMARIDPARHREQSLRLASDPGAAPPLLAGVLVTLDRLSAADSDEVVARLARSQSASAGGPVQREEIARGALGELVRRGADTTVREQLLLDESTPGRLWAAAALHESERLLGPGGLTPSESTVLARRLVGDLGSPALGAERDDDRLELLAVLPFEARFEAVVDGLSAGTVREDAARSLVELAAQGVSPTAGPELGARLLNRARAADPTTQERLVRVHQALPERASPAWQRAEAERLMTRWLNEGAETH